MSGPPVGWSAHSEQVIVTGAGGWVGRNAVALAAQGTGAPDVHRVLALGQRARRIEVGECGSVQVVPMADLRRTEISRHALLVHCGFPTQDQVDAMGEGAYLAAIGTLRAEILAFIERSESLDVVYLSSGAATSVERGLEVAPRTQVYGQAKLDDEAALREAVALARGRLCVVRAFALSGPYMTKPETYALGNMILQALSAGAVEVRATRPVRRSYMAIEDMLRIAVHAVGDLHPGQSTTFETAGEVVEMSALASRVLGALGCDPAAVVRPELDPEAPADDYLGDPVVVGRLAARAGVTPAGLDDQIAVTAGWLRGYVG